jgi:hypothetical protein
MKELLSTADLSFGKASSVQHPSSIIALVVNGHFGSNHKEPVRRRSAGRSGRSCGGRR